MQMTVLTLFPELINAVAQTSITGRAIRKGLIQVDTVQIRDYAVNEYGQVDDTLYGGGVGMLLRPEPVYQAWNTVMETNRSQNRTHQIHPSVSERQGAQPENCRGACDV